MECPKRKNNCGVKILKLYQEVVQGEIDGLEDTIIDHNTYVGISVLFFSHEDQSTISYCDKAELEDWYNSYASLHKEEILHGEETEDGNWYKAYEAICETTAREICGSANGWCMDLARFYSDLLLEKPTEYLIGMFKEGLQLSGTKGNNIWYDSNTDGTLCHVHLKRLESKDDGLVKMTVYGYFSENEEVVDYEDVQYTTIISDNTIDKARKLFDDALGIKSGPAEGAYVKPDELGVSMTSIEMGGIPEEVFDMMEKEGIIADAKEALNVMKDALKVNPALLAVEQDKKKSAKKSKLVKKLKKAKKAINSVLKEMGN